MVASTSHGAIQVNQELIRLCKDCRFWYGAEDDGFGPCALKHQRNDERYITYGYHRCDETLPEDRDDPDTHGSSDRADR